MLRLSWRKTLISQTLSFSLLPFYSFPDTLYFPLFSLFTPRESTVNPFLVFSTVNTYMQLYNEVLIVQIIN